MIIDSHSKNENTMTNVDVVMRIEAEATETGENPVPEKPRYQAEFERLCPMLAKLRFAEHYGPNFVDKIDPLHRELRNFQKLCKKGEREAELERIAAKGDAFLALFD